MFKLKKKLKKSQSKKKVEKKVKVKVNINVGVNNVQGSQMPEMNDPFYTTPEFLGIASGGQVKNNE